MENENKNGLHLEENFDVQLPFIKGKINKSENIPTVCSQRWTLAYLFFWGFFFVYALRVNISVGIVCMVRTPEDNSSFTNISSIDNTTTQQNTCGELDSDKKTHNERAEFDWDKSTKSSLLASFFYGYVITQIPGGWLSDRFGGRRVYGSAMAISGVATLLMPVCARANVVLLYVLRIIVGLATGVCFPAGHSMWGRWAPKLERTKLVSTSQVGAWMGTVVTFATSGLLCQYGFDNGWGSIFYLTGGLTLVWTMLWFYQIRDTPHLHPRISEPERDYIERNVEYDSNKRTSKVPWKEMATSGPLWGIIIAHTLGNWGVYTLLTSLPEFMRSALKFNIKSNGALSALPYICSAVMALSAGQFADFLRSRGILTTAQTRKLFQLIAYGGAGIFIVATGFVPCEKRALAVVFLCLALLCSGFTRGGFAVNHIDIGPKYGGILYGITNTAATIPGMLAPIAAAALTPNDTPEEWRNVFYVSAAFYITGAVVFTVLGSGEVQSWALDNFDETKEVEMDDLKKKMNT